MRESEIEWRCRKLAKARGFILVKWTSPGTHGVHDRLLIIPGRIIPVEIKAPGGKLSRWQERFHAKLDAMGVRHHTVWSVEEFEAILNQLPGRWA